MILTESTMNGEEIKAEYTSSLTDLTCNSKPLINMLTMLAEENLAHAPYIVEAIEEHLEKVQTNVKLPILYLVDCITKNIGQTYTTLFSQNIVKTFCNVFKVVDEETRAEMFKLRQTWNTIFPQMKLYAIDVQINMLDPAWPVTAKPSSNSIHFNPKFLKTSTKPKAEMSTPGVPDAVATPLDMQTYTMQQKLIQKQKELIELQQKKLKLELLQTQVKLQKQLESNPSAAAAAAIVNNLPPRTQNILLKPEVAKQLMPEKQQNQASGSSRETKVKPPLSGSARSQQSLPKIAPANSALVATASTQPKPTRDPRLLRQQNVEKSNNGTTNGSSSVSLGSKPTILDSNNKVVTNTKSVRDSRVEPRLVNSNKDTALPSQNKIDRPPKSFLKSRQSEQKPPKSSRNKITDSDSKSFSKSSTNLFDSPTKSKSDKSETRSPIKSPNKHKKKDHSSNEKKSFKDSKRDRDIKGHKNDSLPSSTFKGIKASKNRNYIRRNRSPSFSPEPTQDTDLRMGAPPEKQPRMQSDAAEEKSKVDVDLRQLSDVSKKRPSSENVDGGVVKKSKTEVFDALFGNEDTDLRTVLPVVQQPERPPTPPPPIISGNEKENEKELPKKVSDFAAVRAKLANATGRDKIMAKSFRKKRQPEDEDLRLSSISSHLGENMKKIIISSDDEQCIMTGTLSKEQEKQLMNKIIAQIEQQKLNEAVRRDKEETNLQPVSDGELDFGEEQDEKFGDKDDRPTYHNKYSREARESRRGGSYWRGGKRRHWDNAHMGGGPHPRQPIRPWIHQNPMNAWRPIGPSVTRPSHSEFGHANQEALDGKKSPEEAEAEVTVDSVNQDDTKTMEIDGFPRDIRYYDETAIVFINWDDPREISFQNGSMHVSFDDKEIYLLSFNEGYEEVSVNGVIHRVRLGAPTREIYIDGKPYECHFKEPGMITIDLDGRKTVVKIEGPTPRVNIGSVKRTDLVAGKVNLIIDAKILIPVFLDAKVQKFVIDGETHTLKFVDSLKTVLINDVPFKVEFGGLPKPITVHGKKHFIRFSVLPRGIKPGLVCIKDMESTEQTAETDDSQDGSAFAPVDINEPALPVFSRKKKVEDEQDRNSNSPHFFQNFMQQNNLDVLSSMMTSTVAPLSGGGGGGYQVEHLADSQGSQLIDSVPCVNPAPTLPAAININELFQKLVATGIVATKEPVEQQSVSKAAKRSPLENLRLVTFDRPETLKSRQSQLYETLYSGMQCSSCGMRFPPEQSMRYSQHLDWHFRQNRKGKKNNRVAASRRWFYSLSDWMNYVEIEDLEERENYFDQQQSQSEGAADDDGEEVEVPSVPADPEVQETYCEVCRDKFDQFFNEDKEEWHLRNAIRLDDKVYHPVCYEDQQASLLEPAEENKDIQEEVKEKSEEQSNIPGLEIVLDDDDDDDDDENDNYEEDDEEMTEEKEEVVIDDDEDDEKKQQSKEENVDFDDDDDVIINEVVPEKIEVDDDREYDDIPMDAAVKIEQIDDGFMDVEEGLIKIKNGGQIKIKSEPVDPDELTVVTPQEEQPPAFAESSQPTIISSIDGNVETISSVPTTTANIGSKIRINISKPLPVITQKETKDVQCESVPCLEPVIDPTQPPPPGEEPVQLNIKPTLRGIEFKKLPPVQKGSELTGMCSIM